LSMTTMSSNFTVPCPTVNLSRLDIVTPVQLHFVRCIQ
jgi:hypothetical protein